MSIHRIRPTLALAALVLAAGCSGDGPTPPEDGSLTGEWSLEMSNLRADDGTHTCYFFGVYVELEQTVNGGIVGSHGPGTGQCVRDDGTPMPNISFGEGVIEGTLDGTELYLVYDGFIWTYGTVEDGEVTGRADYAGYRYNTAGRFRLRRR